jgi:hypothetical protein
MQIELHCPRCWARFSAAPDTPAEEVLQRMIDEGPWCALGDGETFEDMVYTALTARGAIRCPECGERMEVSEESLGQFTRELLMQW